MGLKSVIKPLFYKGLEATVHMRWRLRRKGRAHGLPSPLVISLTSYPKRYDVLALTLKTLMTQSVAADAVVLWIADGDLDALPADVRALEQNGLIIRGTDDLRSYKKIIPALQTYPDSIIVTADDDVYYPGYWLKDFVTQYRPGVPEVLCYRAHRMKHVGDRLAPYDQWQFEIPDPTDDADIFFTGVGGVLYPPGVLHPDVTNLERLKALCPTTDDVWLNWMTRLNGATIRKIGKKIRFYEWPGSQGVALQNSNRGFSGGNDEQIAQIVKHYGLIGVAKP
ncbi:hypothetical protein BJF93_03560 [Xaviernesmea oryzae]|uniref:Glycosyltransferase n=1 Tax=Xaviernesmea oryzae TaxID=464029 RepID=A0A1Q9AUC0_9HYPH|nr:hypothetical protein [Xaviernesmea oryzae]OLP59018.1 hypothetical protein BJF93_03560 [Xaviernesmea oryzae]SEK90415.1 hypothetical protein SAMN04487976_104333 [Xaviernesmea oryzae]